MDQGLRWREPSTLEGGRPGQGQGSDLCGSVLDRALFQYLFGHSGLECSVKQRVPFQKDIGISSVSQEANKARTKDGNFTK